MSKVHNITLQNKCNRLKTEFQTYHLLMYNFKEHQRFPSTFLLS